MLRLIRSALAAMMGLSSEAARNGDWWEIDLILVVLLGSAALGLIAWVSI